MPAKRLWVNPTNVRARTNFEQDIIDNIWKCERIAISISLMTGLAVDELESVAMSCLMKCALSYREDAPANFSTWVNRCLRLHMLNFLRDKSRMVKIPRKYSLLHLKMRKLKKENPDVTAFEAAQLLEVPIEQVHEVNICFSMTLVDIDFFTEEIVGADSGSLSNDLLDWQLDFQAENLDNQLNHGLVEDMTEENVSFLDTVLIRGLCDNTLVKLYRQPIEEIYDKCLTLILKIYQDATT